MSGAAGGIGYGLGVFAVWLVRYMRSVNTSPPAPRWAWIALVVAGLIGQTLAVIGFHVWQDDVRDYMGVPRLDFWDHPLTAVLSIVFLFTFVEIGQLVGKLVRFLVRQLDRVAPPRVSAVVVVTLLLVLTVALLNGIVVRFAMSTLNSTFESANDEEDPDFAAPPPRRCGPVDRSRWSAGPPSGIRVACSWRAARRWTICRSSTGAKAVEPIRVYAGLSSAKGFKAAAELAARELLRTGGLNRAVVAVANTTGTGWINEAEAASLEYMYNGNTAIVSMQYSFLPSWLSFLVDKENARQSSQALFEAVDAWCARCPRPVGPSWWCSARAWAPSVARRRSCR